MVSIQLLFLLFFTVVIAGIVLFFYHKNQGIKKVHRQKLQWIHQSISIHENQIKSREEGLTNYNFLKFNLEESLWVQADIKIL